MIQERAYPALDAVHALLIAAHEATRFLSGPDLGGLVARLRRTAAGAHEAVLYASRRLDDPAGRDELLRARELLVELADDVAVARLQGLDYAAAADLLEYQSQASLALAALDGELRLQMEACAA